MSYQDDQLAALLGSDLDTINPDDVMRTLNAELSQNVSATLSGERPAWMTGVGTAAQRFISFYGDAIRKEICEADRSGLNERYRSIIGGISVQEQMKSLVPAVLAALGTGVSLMNPAVIAGLLALWLVRVGADQWCRLPERENAATSPATATEPASPTTPATPDAPPQQV